MVCSRLPAVLAAALAVLAAAPAPARERRVRLELPPFRIEAYRDREVCRAVRLRNVPGMEVVGWEARSRTARRGRVGSHHLVAYGYQGDDSRAFPADLVDSPGCGDFGPLDFFTRRVFLAGSGGESRRGSWTVTTGGMPPGLAQALPNPGDAPNDAVVVLNSHYFNNSSRPARGRIRVTLRLAPLDPRKRVIRTVTHVDASRGIDVPPGGAAEVSDTWQADGAPNPSTEGGFNPAGDVCVLVLSPHMHKRGMRATIAYEEAGREPVTHWTTTDYLHPGAALFPRGFLLRAHTAANGFPRFRYACAYANGTAGVPMKLGCETVPGVPPGLSWDEAERRGISSLESHATPCVRDADCGPGTTGRCVAANLVFGPLSDDEMCVLTATVYEPRPGVGPEAACDPY